MGIRMCGRCTAELRRPLEFKRQSWRDDMHRSASDGMVERPSPEGEKVRRRKLAKELRSKLAAGDMVAVAKLFITTRPVVTAPPDDNCADCLRLMRGTVPLHVFRA